MFEAPAIVWNHESAIKQDYKAYRTAHYCW